jgi:multimeric flavodoxin WrbA
MNIVILNGNQDAAHSAFDSYLDQIVMRLSGAGHGVTAFTLRDMEIRQCAGCFACWLKTPGLCVHRDDHESILRAYVGSDLVLFASPLVMGFTSALLKRATDRILPILLPYIDGSSGECRHFMRYEKHPLMALLYDPEDDTDDKDRTIVASMWSRLARNARSRLIFSTQCTVPVEEVCHEIAGL